MLIIEVGQLIPPAGSITGASLMTVAQMLRSNTNMNPSNNADNNNSISNSANRGNNGRSADAGGSRIASGNTQPGPVSRLPTPTPAADTTSLANLPRGIRGLDYPAFDVSSEGVYNEDSQAVSRFLAPLQRVFERVYGQNENSNSGTLGTTAEGRNFASDMPPSSRPATTTGPATATAPDPPDGNAADEAAANEQQQNPPAESRNIILTINYVYGGSSDTNENNSGSLLLYVPSIDETNEDNVSVLVRLATEIALRTIAVSLRNSAGVSKQTFEALEVKKVSELKENELECPICYEKYVDKETDEKDLSSKKRKQGEIDEDEDEENPDTKYKSKKRAKDNRANPIPINNSQDQTEKEMKSSEKVKQPVYTHYPIVMKCGHVFGASCLSEWFKTNSSCPLCRKKIPNVMETATEDSRDVTITLPNLARIISNCRPLIENFNNRLMTFSLSEEDDYSGANIVTDNEDQIPSSGSFLSSNGANILERLTTMRRNQQLNGRPNTSDSANYSNENNPNANANADANNSGQDRSRVPSTTNRQSLVNFIRDIVSSLSRRTGEEPTASINNSRLGLHSASGRIPIVRPLSRSGTQFSGMFPPLGVESRRTANGVETREISMFGEHTTRTPAPATATAPAPASSAAESAVTNNSNLQEPAPETSEVVDGSTTRSSGLAETNAGSINESSNDAAS